MAMTGIFTLLLGALLISVALGDGLSEEGDGSVQKVGNWGTDFDEWDGVQSPYERSPYYGDRNNNYDGRYPEYEGNYDYNYDDGLGAGAIAGIVIGSISAAAVVGSGIAFALRRRRRRKNQDIEEGSDEQDQDKSSDLCSLSNLCGCALSSKEGYYDDDGNFVEDI
uniref:Uncharacterized protein n=1 Tax=Rhodosorus marinus TaxID=101924 RepID=A0A7S3EKX7_9RHOD|mmetsp:Transcript_41069/g.162352  ORF Transcript_41069/g.162352 Transcript_41069/m.162352 type:complete len:166 (+) Transcript_41069:336-833(+)|eukprot:CAMPEP_0113961750 /NCGR_PEP_ID=MMETSP0011_2-20120614/5503_1 /TAXON_ID=101924 /ORGANISM="Rhodosorus marinus" /LENGTH=165 /DNA_ID=CAMNT_0000973467 /DNA_START=282 /DNA_END=779 /DNA_ORIENTATION=- /assembly_acc=CAM_ASM_000156